MIVAVVKVVIVVIIIIVVLVITLGWYLCAALLMEEVIANHREQIKNISGLKWPKFKNNPGSPKNLVSYKKKVYCRCCKNVATVLMKNYLPRMWEPLTLTPRDAPHRHEQKKKSH